MEQIKQLQKWVSLYHKANPQDGEALSLYLQKITGILFYLETLRSEVHDKFQTKIFEQTTKHGVSVNRAENEAHVEYPEMYQLRHIMTAGYRITDAIRTNISYLKSEKLNSNN